jgi:hypothetical protein
VHQKDDTEYEPREGIPFYVKKQQRVQETVYDIAWLKATLIEKVTYTYQGDTKPTQDSVPYLFELRREQNDELNPLREAIGLSPGADGKRTAVLKAIAALGDLSFSASDVEPELVSNGIKSEMVVDTDNPYYLNAPLPWFGTNELTQEINDDGTIGKVISKPDTKLAEGISELIPLKEYLTGQYVSETLSDDEEKSAEAQVMEKFAVDPLFDVSKFQSAKKAIYSYELTVETTGYRYTLRKSTTEPVAAPALPCCRDANLRSVSFTRTSLQQGGSTKAEEKKPANAKITGEIVIGK